MTESEYMANVKKMIGQILWTDCMQMDAQLSRALAIREQFQNECDHWITMLPRGLGEQRAFKNARCSRCGKKFALHT